MCVYIFFKVSQSLLISLYYSEYDVVKYLTYPKFLTMCIKS